MRTTFPSRMPTLRIHAGFGIHDAAAFQYEIDLLC
jgi:hypothetical protein